MEVTCQRWFVLSPRHGLVEPEDWIEPYKETLADASEAERGEWSERILAELDRRLGGLKGLEFELHASPEFYEHGLLAGLRGAGANIAFGPDTDVFEPEPAKARANGGAARNKPKQAAAAQAPVPVPPPAPAPRISPVALKRERQETLDEFYALLDEQADRIGGYWTLPDCTGDDHWPAQGVVFFFEPEELRADGTTPRVVRVATHALTPNSKTRLWDRLRADRGTLGGSNPGAGNHRTSAFRRYLGKALIARGGFSEAAASWGKMTGLTAETKQLEIPLEIEVSNYLARMSFVWMAVPEMEDRIAMERGAVSLLSNLGRQPVDPPSADWLGQHGGEIIAGAGLWNQDHTEELPELGLLTLLRKHLDA